MASLPVGEYDREAAESFTLDVDEAGLGVVLSDDYPSLNAGYWVVFTGPSKRKMDADSACARLQTSCYPRYFGIDPTRPLGQGSGHVLAWTPDGTLLFIEIETGDVVRTVGRLSGDGRSPGPPELDIDRWVAYYDVGVEDFWFSCDSSDGAIMRVDLASGRAQQIADGAAPALSPTGRSLVYLAASECYPDPEEPQFVLAPFDTIVVRDLTGAGEIVRKVPLTSVNGHPNELTDVVWGIGTSDLYVLDRSSRVRHFARGSSSGSEIAQLDAGYHWRLLGVDRETGLVLLRSSSFHDGAETSSLSWLDPTDGSVAQFHTANGHTFAAFDATGSTMGIVAGSNLLIDGKTTSLDVEVLSFGW